MAGKGTLESLAILGLVKTMADQFMGQAHMTHAVTGIMADIETSIDSAFALWPDQLSHRDVIRINDKLLTLSDMIPMDHETTITVFTAFMLATLEDFSKKVQPHKKAAIEKIIVAVYRLHQFFADNESAEDDYDENIQGAIAADAWEEATIR